MANVKISELATATQFNNNDYTMIIQSNENKKITKSNMLNSVNVAIGDITTLKTNDTTNIISGINSIMDAEVYSTTEVKTNKTWIDNKPIYMKIIQQTLTNTEEQSYDLNITDLSSIINFGGCIASSIQGVRELNATYFGGLNYAYQTFISSNNKIVIQAGTNARSILNGATLYFYVYYTKTTD